MSTATPANSPCWDQCEPCLQSYFPLLARSLDGIDL
jgi:hypothetical protein